ncbi:MAG: VIT1/CCC1 transporter family protein [Candidatus Aramenus sulfurataquae]|jgi:VIT1/CCC1 family predicted Fe2+/Mn2+ transporter|uniref:VIT1/CCC1 transporter family protein n=3 Tax=Candidatus Aramenus sulfurataquae TaxID=1326980 RepID=A0AAE3FIW8_9CREN|nr:VIT1/CCC1 transporter family protein [Candidatus Aramenus sulfurataquae]
MQDFQKEPVVHYTEEADVFRTKVFGIQDGLIGVGSIAIGAAGYSHDPMVVLITGLIATIAQAFSMGIGEYISTRVRNQVILNEIKKEKYEIENFPEKERMELVGFYLKKGMSKEDAERIADIIMKDKKATLNEMLMNELKMFPEEFEKPTKLGFLMAAYLIVGGLLPLIPFMVSVFFKVDFYYALFSSIALILITLGTFGAMATKFTGLSKGRGALEQIGTGLIALVGSYVGGLVLAHFFPISYLP